MATTKDKAFKASPSQYYKANKLMIHFWTYLGPTTQWTFLIICALLNRLDVYLWGLITIFNGYAVVVYFTQKHIDKKLKTI